MSGPSQAPSPEGASTSRRSRLYVGAPLWAHRPWVGRYLPADTRPGAELAAYASYVNAVEGNTTFHASPSPSTVTKWAASVGSEFRFVFKLPKTITHERRLRDADAELSAFVRLMEPLVEVTSSLVVQLPPSFGPGDLAALDVFLARGPRAWRWSVEVRHLAFFSGGGRLAFERVLTSHSAERVLFDTTALFAASPRTDAERAAWNQKLRVPVLHEALTDRPVVRFLGRDDVEATESAWQPWLSTVGGWLREGRTPSFFVHTPDELDSVGLARRFHELVAVAVPGLRPLPSPPPVEPPAEQATLF